MKFESQAASCLIFSDFQAMYADLLTVTTSFRAQEPQAHVGVGVKATRNGHDASKPTSPDDSWYSNVMRCLAQAIRTSVHVGVLW
jgi:hypothetical protein